MDIASKARIRSWFEGGVRNGASHLIIVCDTFEYSDYPVYVYTGREDVHKVFEQYDGKRMQRVMEVYRLDWPMEPQLAASRVLNF